jgi:hypothetical protein
VQAAIPESPVRRRPWLPLTAWDVQLYRLADGASGLLLLAMTIFCPWAFGTTQPWSISLMNGASYGLGGLLGFKLYVRWIKGYQPPRWDAVSVAPSSARQWITRCLAVLTVMVLAFTLISALNARATYHRIGQSFEYHEVIRWLPQSLDRNLTWEWFWVYLALACGFWSLRDWLLGCTTAEEKARRSGTSQQLDQTAQFLPERTRRFLWLLCLNGAALALEAIAQRLEGSGRLLFLVKPRVNPDAVTQFGPWAYRANASSYFNLLWPVALGFWWTLHRAGGFRRNRHHWLLAGAAIMAAGPVISTSRAGALISAGILALAVLFLSTSHLFLLAAHQPDRRTRWLTYGVLAIFACSASGLGLHFGWTTLKPRLREFDEGLSGREEMYENARPMAQDYVWYGTGPGTFEPVFQLYRKDLTTYWPAQLHNDWLETRITFGRLGLGLILAALGCVFLRWFAPGGIHGGRRFTILCWLALAGCLFHARFDFPFQIYSILHLFLVISALLFTQTRRP